jgi:hypothetical protein
MNILSVEIFSCNARSESPARITMSEAELQPGKLIPEMVAMSEDKYRDYL